MPHHVDITQLAKVLDLNSQVVGSAESLSQSLADALGSGGAHVLVVPVDRKEDLKGRRELDEAAQDALASVP